MLKVGPLLRQYILVIIVNLNLLSTGLGIAWTSPVLVKLSHDTDNPLPEPITEDEGSWIVSIGSIFGCLGNIIASYILDRFGRKYTLLLASLPKLLGFLMLTYGNTVWMLYFGRSVLGLSDSLTFTVVPIYASEVASKEIRGSLGTILQLVCSLGIVIMLCMGPFLTYFTLNLICTLIVVASTIPVFLVPDSPYFLYTKGKKEQAARVLKFLRASQTQAEEEIKEYDVNYNVGDVKIKHLLKSKPVVKALIIVTIIGIGSQATGYNAVTFYLQTVLESTKTSVSSELASVIIGIVQLISCICTILVSDRFGRKPIICSGLVGMSVGLVGLGTFFKLRESGYPITGVLQYLPVVSLLLVVFFYGAGLGSLMWPLLSELFDGQARAFGMSVGLFSTIICIFLTTRFFAPLTNAIGAPATYWAFSINCIVFCLFILFCVPETKGRSFAEIQKALGHKVEESDGKEC